MIAAVAARGGEGSIRRVNRRMKSILLLGGAWVLWNLTIAENTPGSKWTLYAAFDNRGECISALKDLYTLAKEPNSSGTVWEPLGKAVVFHGGQSDTMFCLPAELDPRPAQGK